jgi:PAS domain S-box-containing protein
MKPTMRREDDLSGDELALVLDGARAGTFRLDPDSGELRWSPSLAALSGLSQDQVPATLEDFLPSVHPEDREPLRAAMAATVREGGSHAQEVRVVWADGSVHHTDARWRLVVDEAGRRTVVGIVRNVDRERAALEQTAFLAEVSAVLDQSLDLDRTLSAVADLVVRRIADWCSIDVPEAGGALRNVAVAHVDPDKVAVAHRMRERYPPEGGGQSGAPNVVRTGEPELYAEIPREMLRAGARDAEHLELILALDMTSALVVPLRARGRILGALTLVRTGERPRFCEGDLTFVGEVAARAAIAIDNARLYGELREQRDLYEALLRAQSELGEAFVLLEGERVVYVNEATERLTGRSADELRAMDTLFEVLPPELRRSAAARVEGAFTGAARGEAFRTEVLRPDGTRIPIEAAGRALGAEMAGRMVVIARDITERVAQERERQRVLAVEQAARRASEASHARVRLLSDASALLERSLTSDEHLQEVAELLVARLADACALDIVDIDGRVRRAGAAGRDGLQDAGDDPRVRAVLDGGQAVIVAEEEPEGAPLGASATLVPLIARGRAVGVLSLGWQKTGRRSSREEWSLIEALAQRIALAVDGALQYRQRAHVAQTLQASLLPAGLPRVPGVVLAAEYVAAGEGIEVGGDFYDVFALGEDAWALVIGDVLGKGAEAAAVTALARYTLRAVSTRSLSPAQTLTTLNGHMLRQTTDRRFVTALLGRLEHRADGHARLVVASGGHPPPLVLRADGRAQVLACAGTLLGVEPDARSADQETVLAPGDTVVLYTDGVTEARRDRPLAPEALAEALADTAPRGAAAVARQVVRLAEARAEGPLRDDLAVLVVAIEES